ncbi:MULTISPECIES: hypothetical protein [Methylobacterium]|uniref:hypothetical protein n=1 Tax=Methylobacterium TaxID=407 RepID=UPI0013ED35D0|nr:hypothetical protein [Methylobacterium sp. DB0501]NGM38130.1 hypothetical protein [Methylobacterium sp. DB0501]
MNIPAAILAFRIAQSVWQHDDHLVVPTQLDATGGRCPDCGPKSQSIRNCYHRHPAELPLLASRITLRIEVRRFYRVNPACRRWTFAETPMNLRAPGIPGGFARRRPGSVSPAEVAEGCHEQGRACGLLTERLTWNSPKSICICSPGCVSNRFVVRPAATKPALVNFDVFGAAASGVRVNLLAADPPQ